MRHTLLLVGGLLSSLTFAIQASSHNADHKHEYEHEHSEANTASLESHEHGVASLNLVLEGQDLVLELASPAANIVGFEYKPTSREDLAKAVQARQRLEKAQTLFIFSEAANCVLKEVEAESALFATTAADGNDHHAHHEGGHHDDHAEHHDHGDPESAHSDINAHFHFACANPDALKQIDVQLFEAFPGTEKLLLQAITPTGQQGGELTPAQNVIHL